LTGVAKAFGVSPEAVRRWVVMGCPHISKPGKAGAGYKIDLAVVIEWRIEQERRKILGDVSDIDVEEARRRKLAAEAAMAEHDLAVKQGQAVSIEDAMGALDAAIGASRARLLGLGAHLGPQVAIEDEPAKCQELIDGAVHDALGELSDLQVSEQRNGAGKPPAARAKKPRRVGTASKAKRKRVGRPKKKAQSRGKRGARAVGHRKS